MGRFLRGTIRQTPDRCTSVAALRLGADRITSLKREIWLYIVDWREVVVLCLAKLQETECRVSLVLKEQMRPRFDGSMFQVARSSSASEWVSIHSASQTLDMEEKDQTYFSQHFGASLTSRSIVISPADVSNRTDIV